MVIDKKVRITKLNPIDNPRHKTKDKSEWKDGEENGSDFSPYVGYEVEGFLFHTIEIGRSVIVWREKRNGVEAPGQFVTSRVTEITDIGFNTLNSIYKLEIL